MSEPRLLGQLVIPVVGAALAAALAWAAGVDLPHVALLALVVVLVGAAPRMLTRSAPSDWPEPGEDVSGTGCHLVQLQARVVHECEGDRDRFERSLAPRLRVLSAGRLHAAGHDPARARELLGPALFDPLRPGHAPRRAGAYVGHLLDRLDELDPPPAAARPREDTHP